jgi:hypothetical protein
LRTNAAADAARDRDFLVCVAPRTLCEGCEHTTPQKPQTTEIENANENCRPDPRRIAIIEACDDPDCAAWLNQARAELGVLNAKAELRQALADVEGPVPPKAKVTTAPSEAKSHAGIIDAFKRRGYKDVVLRDAADPSRPHTIRSYKLWLEQGRRVRKGEKGVMGGQGTVR